MIRALITALILLASPILAESHSWPALYDLTGVAADEVLNIRAAPDPSAEIIGTLAPDATQIEVIKANDQRSWGLVNTAERSGWVALRFMERRTGDWFGSVDPNTGMSLATTQLTRCFGTEPFWLMNFNGRIVELSGTEAPDAKGNVISRTNAANRADRFTQFMIFAHRPSKTLFDLITVVRPELCSDGMSDRTYGIGIDFWGMGEFENDPRIVNYFVTGCCSIAPLAE